MAFEKKRTVINWVGFGMVEATLDLILEALNYKVKFDYFLLHSGWTYRYKAMIE